MGFQERFDQFHQLAIDATGLDDFGDTDYHEPMRRYLADLDNYCALNELGKQVISESIKSTLMGRLYTQKNLKDYPQAQATPIEKPIFITGISRTGTTVLHRLMTHDPSLQSIPFWLATSPMPRPPRDSWESYPQYQQAVKLLESNYLADPALHKLHPIIADQPDETSWLVAHTFWLSTVVLTTDLPEYNKWFLNCDNRWTVQYFRRCLALIANGDRRRWLLKDPAHVYQIEAIFEEFPDACIIQTHREPRDALASGAYVAWRYRNAGQPDFDKKRAGEVSLKAWGEALDRFEKFRRRQNPAQFVDVHMLQTRRDPLGTMERVYDHFGIPVTAELRAVWEHQLQANPNQSQGVNKFDPLDFGITKENANKSLGCYAERYASLNLTD